MVLCGRTCGEDRRFRQKLLRCVWGQKTVGIAPEPQPASGQRQLKSLRGFGHCDTIARRASGAGWRRAKRPGVMALPWQPVKGLVYTWQPT